MNREQAAKLWPTVKAFSEGKDIEVLNYERKWQTINSPRWDVSPDNYRVKQTPNYIDWDHVSSRYNYMATDADGVTNLYAEQPVICEDEGGWVIVHDVLCDFIEANNFSSFVRGDIFWKDSLVERPL